MQPAGLKAALDDRLGAGSPTAFAKSALAAVSATATRALLGLGNVAVLNTGAGNGIDADKLDGLEGAAYIRIVASGPNYVQYSDGRVEMWLKGVAAGGDGSEAAQAIAYPVALSQVLDCQVTTQLSGANTDSDIWYQLAGEPGLNSVSVQRQVSRSGTDPITSLPRVRIIGVL